MHVPPKKLPALIPAIVCCLAFAIAGKTQPAGQIKGPVVQNVQQDRATIKWSTGNGDTDFHSIELTGLKPGMQYDIDLKKYGLDAKVDFATAPNDSTPFSFVVFGDTRSRHEVHQKIVDLILREHPNFVIHTGDMVGSGNSGGDWDKFFEIEHDLLRTAAFYPMLGNHERNAEVYYKYFSFPNGDGHRYSFDWGAVHIAVLDTNEFGNTSFEDEVNWLKDDLARNKKPLTFVAFHHPLYTALESRRNRAARLAAKLEPVLLAGGVTAVFGGHDHDYQHHLKNGIHYIVAGGGGAPLYNGSPIPGVTVKIAKVENFVRIHVAGGRAHAEAIDIDGNVLDSFDLSGRELTPPTDQTTTAASTN